MKLSTLNSQFFLPETGQLHRLCFQRSLAEGCRILTRESAEKTNAGGGIECRIKNDRRERMAAGKLGKETEAAGPKTAEPGAAIKVGQLKFPFANLRYRIY
jgi:hypothetical protein